MAIRIKARAGETAEQMLRRFKKLCEKEGLTKDIKRKQYYEKPSERRRRDMRKNETRGTMRPMRPQRGGKSGGSSSGGPGGRSGGGRSGGRSAGGRSGGGRPGGFGGRGR